MEVIANMGSIEEPVLAVTLVRVSICTSSYGSTLGPARGKTSTTREEVKDLGAVCEERFVL